MPPPFRIVDGFVDLDAGMVVRESGVLALTTAEVAVLARLRSRAGEPVTPDTLASALWPAPSARETLAPVLWSLRRKLAPAAEVLVTSDETVQLNPIGGSLGLRHEYLAMVGVEPVDAIPAPAGVQVLAPGLWSASEAAVLVDALAAVPEPVALRAAVVRWSFVPEGRRVAQQAAMGRLRRLLAAGHRLALSDEVIGALHRPVHRIGTWRPRAGAAPASVWGLDGLQGAVGPLPRIAGGPTLAGREEACETCWAAILAGAATVLLHGPEGSGRSTLLATLRAEAPLRLGPRWSVRVLHLGGTLDEAGLLERLARGLQVGGRGSLESTVGRALASLDPLLLVVDDLDEASPEAIEALSRWQRRGARCTVLATAREPLRMPGALWVHLAPLEVPDRCRLVHQGTRGLPGWTDLERDDPVLIGLVREAGGSPLALHALVGRAPFMAPDLLLAAVRMERVGEAPAPGRALLDVAIRRVSDPARAALDRLAVAGRRLSLPEVVAACADLEVETLVVLRELVEAGLLHAPEDPVLLEPWFEVPRAVAELRAGQLQDSVEAGVMERLTRCLNGLARRWVHALDAGGEDVRVAHRIERASDPLESLLSHAGDRPGEVLDVVRALMISWERGHRPAGPLLERLLTLKPPPERVAEHALCVARLACDRGDGGRVRQFIRAARGGEGGIGELALLLDLDAHHLPRHTFRSQASGLVQALHVPRAERIPLLPEMLDHLLISGHAADVIEIADRHASLAASRGSRWRTALLALQGFRARAGLGRHRAVDLRTAREQLALLREVGDHRRFAAGLQWLVRALIASGDPAGALHLLDRSWAVIDAHGVYAVRHMARIDRGRALLLLGHTAEAAACLDAYDALQAAGPRLSPIVGAFERVLHAVGRRDAQALTLAVEHLGHGPARHHRLAAHLAGLDPAFRGAPTSPGSSTARRPAERLLAELVEAWRQQDEPRMRRVCQRIRSTPEWRSIALPGVVLRVAVHALESALDPPGLAD